MTFLTTVIALGRLFLFSTIQLGTTQLSIHLNGNLEGAMWPRTLIFFVLDATTKKICIPDQRSAARVFSTVANVLRNNTSLNPFAHSPRYFSENNTCKTKSLTLVIAFFILHQSTLKASYRSYSLFSIFTLMASQSTIR